MVVSGAPEKQDNHAEKVCNMALDMVEAITDLKDPSTGLFQLLININIMRCVEMFIPALIFTRKIYIG